MKYLAPKLKHRFQLLRPDERASDLSIEKHYIRLLRIWGSIKTRNIQGINGLEPIRNVNIGTVDTHEITVRFGSIYSRRSFEFGDGYGDAYVGDRSLGAGKEFDVAFSSAFNSIQDFDPVKANYYFYKEGATPYQGQLFKINRVIRDDNYKEFLRFMVTQEQERGTGFPA